MTPQQGLEFGPQVSLEVWGLDTVQYLTDCLRCLHTWKCPVGSGHIGPGGQEICLDKKIDESSEYRWKLET